MLFFDFLLLSFDFKKSYKPVSRILFHPPQRSRRRSRLSFICPGNYLSGSICLPGILNEQFSNDPIRGISACKVYPPMMSPSKAVSSYLTFSPFHFLFPSPLAERGEGWGYFLWHCLSPTSRGPAIHRCIALRCPDFPPRWIGTIAWLVAKI